MPQMTSTERVIAVLNHQIPDRVPHFEWVHDLSIIKALSPKGTYEDLIDEFDIDAIMCKSNYRQDKFDDELTKDEWGIIRKVGAVQYPMPIDEKAPIKSIKDFDRWIPPDPTDPYRWSTLEKRVTQYKNKRAIFVNLRDVWSYPRDLFGYIDLCILTIDNPKLIKAVIEQIVDHTLQLAETASKLGAEVVVTGDDIAESKKTLISPKVWGELFLPYFKKLCQGFHELGMYHWKHSDGNIMPVIDTFVEAGVDGIDPIDPLGGMDLATVKQAYGNKVAIKGNIDCVNLLTIGTKDDVVKGVKNAIRIAGVGGGYVCSSSNSIFDGINPELYKTMVEAIHEYGTYPLNLNKLNE